MKKYEQLAKDYANTIAEIKRLRAERAAADQRYHELAYTDKAEVIEAYQAASEADEQLTRLECDLEWLIYHEYANCPYAATRQQGIAGFYRVAGL